MYYAIVSFGGTVPGTKVFGTMEAAHEHIVAVERDTMGDGEYYCDLSVLAKARVNEYETREAAEVADISDTRDSNHRRPTPGFVRTVFVRS
jgi:hypothetical protein